jgi:hypothetical protein
MRAVYLASAFRPSGTTSAAAVCVARALQPVVVGREQVAVAIHGHRDPGVTGVLGDRLRADVLRDQQRDKCPSRFCISIGSDSLRIGARAGRSRLAFS